MGLERLQAPAAHAPPPPAAGAAGTPAWCCMRRGWTHRERCRQPASRKSAVALAWVRRVHQNAVCTACREGLAGLPPEGQRCACAGRPESSQLNISLGIYLGKGCWVMRTAQWDKGALARSASMTWPAWVSRCRALRRAVPRRREMLGLSSGAFCFHTRLQSSAPPRRSPVRSLTPPGAVALDSRCRLPHLDS
jgi:hypothetical protein